MANQFDVKPTVFETISNQNIGTFALNVEQYIKLNGSFKNLMTGIVLKQGVSVIPGSAYDLFKDDDASAQETAAAGSTVDLYGQIRITNNAYVGVELNISGNNYGAYASNNSIIEFLDLGINGKISPIGGFIEENEVMEFGDANGLTAQSANTGSVVKWDAGTIYNTPGTLARESGLTAVATGLAGNQNKDPFDPLNVAWWFLPDEEKDLLRQANRGKPLDGDMHTIHDRSGANYQQNLLIGKKEFSGVVKDIKMVHLDGSVVTGNATLEAIFDVGGGNEYPYLDLYAPDLLGTRTLIDMGEHLKTPMSVSGENDVLGEMLDDRGQGHRHESQFGVIAGGGTQPATSSVAGDTTVWERDAVAESTRFAFSMRADGSGITPRFGFTTRPKELTVGASYIIVIN